MTVHRTNPSSILLNGEGSPANPAYELLDHPSALIRILLIEEHVVLRRGLRLLIDAEPDLSVCGGFSTIAEAIEAEPDPDLVVHGLVLSDGAGPEIVRTLRQHFPRAGLLALSRLENPTFVHLALVSGDNGYLLKSATPEEMLDAVRRVARGEDFVQPSLGAALAKWSDIPQRHAPNSFFSLTTREQEVLDLLALGHTNVEIADVLNVALRTVEAHRTHVTQKLDLHSRAELVRFVHEQSAERLA